MNNTSIIDLEKSREEKKKKYGLDSEGISEFRSKIKVVSEEEADRLGKEMFDCIAKKGFNDNLDSIMNYIYNGANIEYKNEKKGDFSLLICARKGYFKTFLALLKAGANVNQTNNFLTTATMAAARHGFKDILELLILMGADVNAICKDGDTALISAKRHDQVECFNMLVNNNASLFHQNLMQETVLEIKSSKPFDLSQFAKATTVRTKVGATAEEAEGLIDEAAKALKKILEQK